MKLNFSKMFRKKPAGISIRSPKNSSEDVAAYYEDYTDQYLEATGDFIQAYRTFDTDSLMEYLVESMGLKDGMDVLDAGSGVCAPAIWIAERFPNTNLTCITNSERQFEIATGKIRAAGLESRIILLKGDYHELTLLCAEKAYDLAIFLESLGHNQDLEAVLKGLNHVVKSGGQIYIKDFFRRLSNDPVKQEKIDEAIEVIDRNYSYNVMNLPELIESTLKNDFTLSYARVPETVSDIAVTIAFEDATGRLTYPAFTEIRAVDWYEILAIRD
jgi:cyclopropane fatty-acyl-phospholipid synthase-like methyltransferase